MLPKLSAALILITLGKGESGIRASSIEWVFCLYRATYLRSCNRDKEEGMLSWGVGWGAGQASQWNSRDGREVTCSTGALPLDQ